MLPWMAMILFFGAMIQGAVGFGLGIVTIPLFVFTGLSLPQAIGATLPAVLVQTSFNCWQHRTQLPFREVWPLFLLRLATLPLGLWLLQNISELDITLTKQVIGGFLLFVLLLQLCVRPEPRHQLPFGWTLLAGSVSGFLVGTVGMGGPPISLWVMAHDWAPTKQRIFLWLTFLLVLPFHVVLLYHKFGPPLLQAMLCAAMLTPATMAGAWIGSHLGGRMDRRKLRVAMVAFLFFVAIRRYSRPMWLFETTSKADRKISAGHIFLD